MIIHRPPEARLIAEELIQIIDLERLDRTGNLSPGRSLKQKVARRWFQWTDRFSFGQRFFTKGAIRRAIQLLIEEHGVDAPTFGAYDALSWMSDQVEILQLLNAAKRCRTRSRADAQVDVRIFWNSKNSYEFQNAITISRIWV